jgi:Icc-related predicted phosphoesterase
MLKFVTISDTHGKHQQLALPKGDVLIHAGDISSRGHKAEVMDFINWFSDQDFEFKIFIGGNHDFYFEKATAFDIKSIIPDTIFYLNDSGVTIQEITIWGSPISPWFYNWAFNRHRGAAIKKHWDLIPHHTNIIVTHGPVCGILDKTISGSHVGCEDLLHTIKVIQPQVHICGHIHEAYGKLIIDDTLFINASVLNHKYELANAPIVFDV